MKFLFSILVISTFSLTSMAATKLCPKDTTEVLKCTSDSVVAFVPFTSICETPDAQLKIVLDPGAGRSGMVYLAERTETENEILFTATEENVDNLKLTVIKSDAKKQKAILSMVLFSKERQFGFTCK